MLRVKTLSVNKPPLNQGTVVTKLVVKKLPKYREIKLKNLGIKADDLLDTIKDALFRLDSDLCFTYINQAGKALASRSKDGFIGRKVYEVFPTVSPTVLTKISGSIEQQKVQRLLTYNPALEKWWEVKSFPNHQGTTCFVSDVSHSVKMALKLRSLNRDLKQKIAQNQKYIAERKQFEKALLESEQKLTDIINFLPDATFVIDNQGRVIAWNKAIEKMTGVKAAEVLGRGDYCYGVPFYGHPQPVLIDMVRFFDKKHADRYGNLQIRQSNLSAENFCPGIGENGAFIYGKATPLYDTNGNIIGAIESIRDISERKQAQEHLLQSEERFMRMFHSSPDMMIIYDDKNHSIIEVNQQALEIMGFSRSEVIGNDPIKLGVVNTGEYISIINSLQREGKILNNAYDFRTRSGKSIKTISSLEYIYLNGSIYILLVSKDATKEKQLEADLARLDRLHLIGEMAASIGHEVRNPMTSVRGFLQLLNSKEENYENRSYYQLMMDELDRANSIISEFLSMARDKRVELELLNLNNIVNSIAPMIQAEAVMRENQIILQLGCCRDLLLDKSEIRQLLLNLSRNGLEAMQRGGSLTIGTYSSEENTVLYVNDQGSGFSTEAMCKAGTPFFSTKDNGSGLGLAVCYSIANRHNAKIEIESDACGSTIFIKFPNR